MSTPNKSEPSKRILPPSVYRFSSEYDIVEKADTYADIHEFEIMVGSELRRTWATTLYSAGYGYDRRTMTNQPVVFPSDSQAFPLHTKTNVEDS